MRLVDKGFSPRVYHAGKFRTWFIESYDAFAPRLGRIQRYYPLRAPYPFSAEAYVKGAKKDLGHFKSLKLAQEAIEKACEGES